MNARPATLVDDAEVVAPPDSDPLPEQPDAGDTRPRPASRTPSASRRRSTGAGRIPRGAFGAVRSRLRRGLVLLGVRPDELARWGLDLGPVAVGAGLVAHAVTTADPAASGGVLGLVAVLPVSWWLGVAAVIAGFARLVGTAPERRWALAAHLVAMVVILHATPGLIEPHPRFPTAWTHVGFVDRIVETGEVDPGYDARYNWPGAFSFGALLVRVTGSESARDLLRFAPVVVNLLLLAPLSVVLGHVTRDVRLRWAAAWLVVVTGWVGQDYLAPQALAIIGYLTVVGVLLRWFRDPSHARRRLDLVGAVRRRWPSLTGDRDLAAHLAPSPPTTPVQRLGLVAVVVAVGGALAFSHQLTPLLLPVAVLALVLFGGVDAARIAAILALCAAAWLAFGTTDYLRDNLADLVSGLGDVGAVVGENVGERTSPDALRRLVLSSRMALTAGVAALACAGAVRQWRRRRLDWAIVALALAPVGLLALNSYGGEMVLRVSLFSLPFLAVLAAFAVVGERADPSAAGPRHRWPGLALGALSLAVVPVFVVARYGNEAYERIEGADIAAWEAVVEQAEPGSVVVVPDFAGPWRYRDLMLVDYRVYADLADGMPDAEGVAEVAGAGGDRAGVRDAYVVLGTASARYGVVAEGYPEGWADDLAADLVDTGDWRVVFAEGDTQVLARSSVGRAGGDG